MLTEFNINALMPQEMAEKAETIGVRKAGMAFSPLFVLSMLAGASFEHSVANMYFIPFGLFIKAFDTAFAVAQNMDLSTLNWGSFFLKNLLPVTICNIIGGAGLVAIVYWFIYLNPTKAPQSFAAQSASTHLDVGPGKAIETRS